MKMIERTEYLDWLKSWKEQQIIKVVSGVRRCGKSTLFELYKNWLVDNGVDKQQIISINFVYTAPTATAARSICHTLPLTAHGHCPAKYDILDMARQ